MAQGFGQRVLKPQEQREAKILKRRHSGSIIQEMEDPRVERGRNHPLVSLVSIAIFSHPWRGPIALWPSSVTRQG